MEEVKSLFNEVAPSTAELRGEGETAGAETRPAADIILETESGAAKSATGTAGQETEDLEALRADSNRLTEEIGSLRRELEETRTGRATGEVDAAKVTKSDEAEAEGFRVLTDEEYESLVEDDPVEALKYQGRLRRHERDQKEKKEAVKKEHGAAMMVAARMAEELPGLYSENSEVAKALVEFCEGHGLDRETLGLLVDPSTKVLVPDGKGKTKAVPIGEAALRLTRFIAASYETGTGKKVRASTKRAAGKVSEHYTNRKDGGDEFPRTDAERELARMSPDQQKKYLGG